MATVAAPTPSPAGCVFPRILGFPQPAAEGGGATPKAATALMGGILPIVMKSSIRERHEFICALEFCVFPVWPGADGTSAPTAGLKASATLFLPSLKR